MRWKAHVGSNFSMTEESPKHCETFVRLQKQGVAIDPPLRIEFSTLAQGKTSVLIMLDGETYRLQLTKNQKLILTK